MNNNIQLLDCTLRDGCYIVESNFGATAIKGIIDKLQDANVDLIECGWLKNKEYTEGTAFYHVPSDLEPYLTNKDPNKTYIAMIDWDRYDADSLPEYDGKSIDAIRVVFPYGKHEGGIQIGRKIMEKGYKVYFQAANTLAYNDDDLIKLVKAMNEAVPVCLSVVDTFGAMYEEDLERIVNVINANLKPEIKIGFHSHNNQQLSFALTMHFIKMLSGSNRGIIVDSSLCGMGRGAGNATTELVVSYLNRKHDCHYDLDAIMDAIDVYMSSFQENYEWGYSTPYFIAGMYCCHVNNIAYLLNSHRTTAKDMRNIIESLSPEDRKKYDYDLLESKYIENQNRYVEDADAIAELKSRLIGRNVILIAPGKTALSQKMTIDKYAKDKDAVIIAVNAILTDHRYDYLFFVNSARYEYAKQANPKTFGATKHIVLSNIKNAAEDGELVITYDRAIKRGWEHFDNAMICCLRLMDHLGVEKVAVAGFDGFQTKYNESYADPFLPTLNPDNKWDELNEEITEMFMDYKQNAKHCKEIEFITESLFNV